MKQNLLTPRRRNFAFKEGGQTYFSIGMIDDNNNIVAASVILSKRMGLFNRYGYAPKGFLIDYYNPTLIKEYGGVRI